MFTRNVLICAQRHMSDDELSNSFEFGDAGGHYGGIAGEWECGEMPLPGLILWQRCPSRDLGMAALA